MSKFFKWAGGLLEDQTGSASSKRLGFYWALAMASYMIVKDTNGAETNMEMFWGVISIVLVGYGLITSEFFKKKFIKEEPKV